MATVKELRTAFDGMSAQEKREYIDKLKTQAESSGSPEYKQFYNECVRKYKAEVTGDGYASKKGKGISIFSKLGGLFSGIFKKKPKKEGGGDTDADGEEADGDAAVAEKADAGGGTGATDAATSGDTASSDAVVEIPGAEIPSDGGEAGEDGEETKKKKGKISIRTLIIIGGAVLLLAAIAAAFFIFILPMLSPDEPEAIVTVPPVQQAEVEDVDEDAQEEETDPDEPEDADSDNDADNEHPDEPEDTDADTEETDIDDNDDVNVDDENTDEDSTPDEDVPEENDIPALDIDGSELLGITMQEMAGILGRPSRMETATSDGNTETTYYYYLYNIRTTISQGKNNPGEGTVSTVLVGASDTPVYGIKYGDTLTSAGQVLESLDFYYSDERTEYVREQGNNAVVYHYDKGNDVYIDVILWDDLLGNVAAMMVSGYR